MSDSEKKSAESADARQDDDAAQNGAASVPQRAGQNDTVGDASLANQLAAALAERDTNFERWARTQAEFENYRKRAQREADQNRQYQAFHILGDLLPVLDNLERAVAAAETSQGGGELIEGVRLVLRQFEDVLTRHGAAPIEAVGRPFDPNLHQAIQQVPAADHPPLTVLAEAERGWTVHDRVLRPSKVVVSSPPPEPTDQQPS